MDLTTSVTILSGLATFLGFVWSIFHSYQKKKDESDSEDDECQDVYGSAPETDGVNPEQLRVEQVEHRHEAHRGPGQSHVSDDRL